MRSGNGGRRRRLAALAGLALALGASAWGLFVGGLGEPRAPSAPGASDERADAPPVLLTRPADSLGTVPARERSGPGPLAASEAAAGAPATPRLPPAPPGAAAVLRVRLSVPDAWLVGGGTVYALPAGAPGRASEADLPHVQVPAGGSEAVLPLPREGLWDVGFLSTLQVHVLVEDVDVPRTGEVMLTAVGAAPIRFRIPRTGALPEGGWLSVDGTASSGFPGRGQPPGLHLHLRIDPRGPIETPPLSLGVEFALRVGTADASRVVDGRPVVEWALARERASAGEEVDLLVRPLGLVRNVLRLSAPLPQAWLRDWKTDPWIAVGARGAGEAEPTRFASTYLRRDGTFGDGVLWLPLPPGRHLLTMPATGRWTPSRTPPRTVDVEAGRTAEVEWSLDPDPALVTPWTYEGQPAVTSVVLRTGRAPEGSWLLAAEVEREGVLRWDRHGGGGPGSGAELDVSSDVRIRRAVLWLPPDRATRPFQIPASGSVDAPLLPAGYVVLVPEVIPDPGLGALRVRRRDGLPLPVTTSPPDWSSDKTQLEPQTAPTVVSGLRLGPIPEGPLELEVLLGGEVVGRVTVDVRAGKQTPLAIPLPSPPVR